MHKTSPHLDGQYAAFGKVIEGMEIVNKIAECKTDYADKPLENQVMKTVTVDTSARIIRSRRNADPSFHCQNNPILSRHIQG